MELCYSITFTSFTFHFHIQTLTVSRVSTHILSLTPKTLDFLPCLLISFSSKPSSADSTHPQAQIGLGGRSLEGVSILYKTLGVTSNIEGCGKEFYFAAHCFPSSMHATRCWIGQTFALAKGNESSGGKKTRVRRSKEERKGMVESFIKRYQKLNEGSFPSLSLTHREVGGSFYTVREIVREIIQENRVLAPPKLLSGEEVMENLDDFLEHSPLGSVSVDPHIHVVPPKDTKTLVDEYELRSERVLNSKTIIEHGLDKDNINGIRHTTVRNEELEDSRDTELLAESGEKCLNDEEEIIDADTSQTSRVDIVETTHEAVANQELSRDTELLVNRGEKSLNDEEDIIDAETSETSGGGMVETTHEAGENVKIGERMYTESLIKRGNEEQKNEGTELEPTISKISEAVVVETTHATVGSEEFEEPNYTEMPDMQGQKDEVKEREEHQAEISYFSEGVVVETFPLRHVSDNHKEALNSNEKEVLAGDLEEKDVATVELATGNNKSSVHGGLHLLENSTEEVKKLDKEVAAPLPESEPTLASQESQNQSPTIKGIALDVNDGTCVKVENTMLSEDKALNDAKYIKVQNLDGNNSSSSLQRPIFDNTNGNTIKSTIQPAGDSQKKRSDATLNRINLESWEASSKRSDHQETNPIVAFIRTCVSAFVKFWSE